MGNQYEVLRKLGQGGMGTVFLAKQKNEAGFERMVALKKLSGEAVANADLRGLFEREIRLGARLVHPNIVQVLDGGLHGAEPYLTTEFVDGGDLEDVMNGLRKAQQRLPPEAVAFVGSQVCQALAFMRTVTDDAGKPLIQAHRDVSPGNVLVSRQGAVKLADFGVARLNVSNTSAAVVRGKWQYFAPEIATQDPDVRADLFALALVLHQLATLRHPFEASTAQGYYERASTIDPPRPEEIPEALWSVIYRGLAKDPELRFQTPEEMGEALEQFMFAQGRAMNAPALARLIAPLLPAPVPQTPDPAVAAPLKVSNSFELDATWQAAGPELSADGHLVNTAPPVRAAPSVPRSSPASAPPRAEPPGAHEGMVTLAESQPQVHIPGAKSLAEVDRLELHDKPLVPRPEVTQTLLEPPRRPFPLGALIAALLVVGVIAGGAVAYQRGLLRGLPFKALRGEPEVVLIDSTPPGAEVYDGEHLLGTTPLSFENEATPGSLVTLTVVRKGYAPAQAGFPGGHAAHVSVQLKKAK